MANEKTPKKSGDTLIVTSKTEGFRRAGRAWSCTPTEVAAGEFDAAALAALEAEPMLTVERVTAGNKKAAE